MNNYLKEKILLVDDEEGIRKVLEISLLDSGYNATTAGSGRQAIEKMEEDLPSLLITDIKMPDMDGISLLKYVKENHPEIEVIMITGHGELDLAIKSIQYGAIDFVTKPIDTLLLETSIERSFKRIFENKQISGYAKKLETDIRKKDAQIKENSSLIHLGQTVAGIAHGIKNIAGGLKGGEFILEQGIIHDDKTYVIKGWEMIKGNLNKISALSLDMLSYSKITDNNFIKCDPNLPVREVFELLKSKAEKQDISMATDLSKNMPLRVFDPEEIHCAILNLVTNAIEAFSQNPDLKRKEILITSKDTKEGGIQYEISDTAGGIEEKIKGALFKRFLTTKGKKGTGFGLMLTKKIVDQHHGEIKYSSEKNKGTCFTLKIPGNLEETKLQCSQIEG